MPLTWYLQATFGEEVSAYTTPALPSQSIWTRQNRIQKRSFTPLAVLVDDQPALPRSLALIGLHPDFYFGKGQMRGID
ncbi:hypothetical protein [Ktedonobacter sp. SOSP1-52]|uniref:hypothetical protein n=1 Tax=Ktedonobacter sp. SOSP1-52 TaxID=2778366 RepID=UPI0019159A4B|nr:hypothetical protein [Ktedonobacter sp. SOSP1-52]